MVRGCRAVSLLAWVLAQLVTCCQGYTVNKQVRDEVMAGEARFYSIDTPGMMIVAVLSLEGDADIYSSTTNKQPSSEAYEYAATSYGLDILVLPADRANKRVYIGVYGHVRYENTSYQLYVILPDEEDIRRYQVWDWDPEIQEQRLIMDVDSLVVANDPTLNVLLEELMVGESVAEGGGVQNALKTVIEWGLFLFLKTLEFVVEVLV